MTRRPFNPDLLPPPDDEPAGGKPLSVTELTAMVKRALARLPAALAVTGEISNLSRSANGHVYFTLKDPGACIDCVMWRSGAGRLKFTPADGLSVVAFGQVGVYEPRGRYQLYVSRLQPRGTGELELAFRQLYEKLSGRGWFDPARKRPIPLVPRTIGLVTSRTGAAVRDILRTLAIRWPNHHVILADARVQGEGAAESVAAAIERINRYSRDVAPIDVLIVSRGGGSLEDLWPFNTEIVARAILESDIPVVSGVGHEIDTTIADLVADVRAATPTAAAQRVVPDFADSCRRISHATGTIRSALRKRLGELRHRLAIFAAREFFRRPGTVLRTHRQRLDELAARMTHARRVTLHQRAAAMAALAGRLERRHPRLLLTDRVRRIESLAGRLRWVLSRTAAAAERKLSAFANRLAAVSPAVRVAHASASLARMAESLGRSARLGLARRGELLEARRLQLDAYDPRSVLRRGYSMTTSLRTGKLVTAPSQVRPGDRLTTELADGRIESEVVAGGLPPPRQGRHTRHDTNQQSLFEDGTTHGEK